MSVRPRLAVISTHYRLYSHSDVIVTRWMAPFATDHVVGWPVGGGDKPRTEIVSLYIHQIGSNDVGLETAAKHGVPVYQTVRDTLTLGSDTLAVDGVLLIGEHGDFPLNEFFQKMYPRRELFDEIVAVFRESGRSVPVFNDKHFSYAPESAKHMVATAHEMGFPLMAGSSIPLRGNRELFSLSSGLEIEEGMGLFYGNAESYGYHSIEFLQSIVACRKGGESGIKSVTSYYGESYWQAESEARWSADLLMVASHAARQSKPGHYRRHVTAPPDNKNNPHHCPAAFCFEHQDGLKTSHLLLNGYINDFLVAIQESNANIHYSGENPVLGGPTTYYRPFAILNKSIEEFLLTGKSPFPVEHSLFCTLALSAAMRALATPGQRIETPDLHLPYKLST